MGVVQSYNVGGVIDEVKKINLPPHLFPRKERPFIKGLRLEIPPIKGKYSIDYLLEMDMELVNIAVAGSGYKDLDEWEAITIQPGKDPYKVVETMPTRELAESINMGNVLYIAHRLESGSIVRFEFNNASQTSKTIWISLRFLR